VCETTIIFKSHHSQEIGGKQERIPIVIDGVKYEDNVEKVVVRRCKKENSFVTLPIMSFLPLRQDDLVNFKI